MKRHEKQIDLTLSLLHATFGVVYHLIVELPQSLLLSVVRHLPLWPFNQSDTSTSSSNGASGNLPSASARTGISKPYRTNLNVEAKPQPRRVSPSSKTSRLPEWPPPKRSVYSEDTSTNRKPSLPKTAARTTKPAAFVSRTTTKTLPTEVSVTKRRNVSGAARAPSGGAPVQAKDGKVKAKPTRGDAVEKATAKLRSLPRPPSGDPDYSSASSSSPPEARPRRSPAALAKSHPDDDTSHTHVSPKKRSRDDQDDSTSIPPKRRASRKTATAQSSSEANSGGAKPPGTKAKVAPASGKQRSSSAATKPKARTASSSAAGKRSRVTDEGDTPPKRTRSTRSTMGKRTTS